MTRTIAHNNTRPRAALWIGFLAPVLVVVLLVVIATNLNGSDDDHPEAVGLDFALPDTTGATVRLGDVLAERDALLYFSMGVGCDGCFLQIPEIAGELEERDVAFIPIMVDRPDWLAAEANRLGVATPIAIDADRAVSEAYGMLGQYGHGDRPSHSFALVRQDGRIDWVRHYSEMFVPADQFFAEMPG